MSSQTRIVILKMRNLIYTGIFIFLLLILIVLMILMFGKEKPASENTEAALAPIEKTEVKDLFYSGQYSCGLRLGEEILDLSVIINENTITAVQLSGLSKEIKSSYPLLEPAFQSLKQKLLKQPVSVQPVYDSDMKYTQEALYQTIRQALLKAQPSS